jgi:hypothetical protein
LKTHYSKICHTHEQLKEIGIQKEILHSLKEKEMDPKLLKLEMKQNIFSVGTSCYKQLARELEIQNMCETKSKIRSRSQPFLSLFDKNAIEKQNLSSTSSKSKISLENIPVCTSCSK